MTPLSDTSSWPASFEPLLDALLAVFCPGWTLAPLPAPAPGGHPYRAQYRRCGFKRCRLAQCLRDAPSQIPTHAERLLHAVMHDLDPSRNVTLIEPVIGAVGYRVVHEAIVRYVETGTTIQQSAATMAWYAAQPIVRYPTREAYERREPTPDSIAVLADIAGLDTRYRSACFKAAANCQDAKTRSRLLRSAEHPHYTGVQIG